MSGRSSTYAPILPLVVLLWTISIGCESTFEPLKENDYVFSISGYLDATADTQWVRVMPVRDSLLFEPSPIDATVTLDEIGSNKSTTMNDSLFSYLDGGGSYAHVFWTTMDLLPEHTYRLTAERSDGMSSSAEVTIPSDFPTPMVQENFVYIHNSIDRLGDVQSVYHGRDSFSGTVRIKTYSHFRPEDTTRTGLDFHSVYIDQSKEDLTGFPPVVKSLIFVAAVGPDYHNFGSIDENVLAIPDGASNIENGLGYLAGIVSKTIPFQSCYDNNGMLTPCPTDPPPW